MKIDPNLMNLEDLEGTLKEKMQKHKNLLREEFYDKGIIQLSTAQGVGKYKSVRRAIKRGCVDLYTGTVYPNRPFNNRKNTPGRKINKLKQKIYAGLER